MAIMAKMAEIPASSRPRKSAPGSPRWTFGVIFFAWDAWSVPSPTSRSQSAPQDSSQGPQEGPGGRRTSKRPKSAVLILSGAAQRRFLALKGSQ